MPSKKRSWVSKSIQKNYARYAEDTYLEPKELKDLKTLGGNANVCHVNDSQDWKMELRKTLTC